MFAGQLVYDSDFAISPNGDLVAASVVSDGVGEQQLLRVRLRGAHDGSWADISAGDTPAWRVRVATDPLGKIGVAYYQYEVLYIEYNSSDRAWNGLGGSESTWLSSTPPGWYDFGLALDQVGRPYIVFTSAADEQAVFSRVVWWDGHAWTSLSGGDSDRGVFGAYPHIAFDASNSPVVAACDKNRNGSVSGLLGVYRWSGASWATIDGGLVDTHDVYNCVFDFAARGGTESLVYHQSGPPGIVKARLWNSGSMADLQIDSAVGQTLVVTIDDTGTPIVGWMQNESVDGGYKRSLHVSRWDDATTSWTAVRAHSATEEFIASYPDPKYPRDLQLRINGDHLCAGWSVATYADTGAYSDTYVIQCTDLW